MAERVLAERLDDGGWNCEAENGSVRSSFDTTINVLDGLLEFERATGESAGVRTARRSGEEYLLERGLFRRKSSGEIVRPDNPQREAGAAEIAANEVGLAILGPLRELDEVAYLRFASVYRGFESLADFEAEIQQLKAEKGES